MAIPDSLTRFQEAKRVLAIFLLLILGLPGGYSQTVEGLTANWTRQLEEARRTFNDSALDRLIAEVTPAADRFPQEFDVQHLLSKVYLIRCDLRRFNRKTYEVTREENKSLRNQQEELAKRGMVYADRALALRPESSEAHRVSGELWIHQITGPLTGFRFGPKGKESIEKAIQLDPQNLEARRALGLMYLYNPPFNGGDKKKAAETFDEISEAGGGDHCYVLAARAYLEREEWDLAVARLKKAVELNPENVEAKKLLDKVKSRR